MRSIEREFLAALSGVGVGAAGVAAMTFVVMLSVGCSTLGDARQDNPALFDASVTAAAGQAIDGDQGRARRMAMIARDVQTMVSDSDEPVRLETLEAAVRRQVDWESMNPEARDLMNAFLAYLAAEMRDRIGAGDLEPDERVLVSDVAELVIARAERV